MFITPDTRRRNRISINNDRRKRTTAIGRIRCIESDLEIIYKQMMIESVIVLLLTGLHILVSILCGNSVQNATLTCFPPSILFFAVSMWLGKVDKRVMCFRMFCIGTISLLSVIMIWLWTLLHTCNEEPYRSVCITTVCYIAYTLSSHLILRRFQQCL